MVRHDQRKPTILQVDLEVEELPPEYVYILPYADSPKNFLPVFSRAMKEMPRDVPPVERVDRALEQIRKCHGIPPFRCKRLVPGAHIRLASEHGSVLNGVSGTIVSRARFFDEEVFRVRFDAPVVYPGGLLCESDIAFLHEIRTLPMTHQEEDASA